MNAIQNNLTHSTHPIYYRKNEEADNSRSERFREIKPGSHEVHKASKVAGAVLVTIGISLIFGAVASLILLSSFNILAVVLIFTLILALSAICCHLGLNRLTNIN